MARIDVAMSGGVDSTAAAILLLDAGHDVRGVTMRLMRGQSSDAVRDASETCMTLGIPHEIVDLRQEFEGCVLGPYADGYAAGRTPNPCVTCNETVKFGALLRVALDRGAERLATGHYASIHHTPAGPRLGRGVDVEKDQSYFLYRLGQDALEHTVFPLAAMVKAQAREITARRGLRIHEKPESQEACFTRQVSHLEILRKRHPEALLPGPTIDVSGSVLGHHSGIGTLTVGQRRGLGTSGGPPKYVAVLRADDHTAVVGDRDELLTDTLLVEDVVWHASETTGRCTFRFRHGRSESAGVFSFDGDVLRVRTDEPVWGVAPGQSLVCYKEDVVLGGGVLKSSATRTGGGRG